MGEYGAEQGRKPVDPFPADFVEEEPDEERRGEDAQPEPVQEIGVGGHHYAQGGARDPGGPLDRGGAEEQVPVEPSAAEMGGGP